MSNTPKNKQILFITHLNPFKCSFGAEQRTNIALKAFIANNCHVDVAYIGNEEPKPVETEKNVRIVFWNTDAPHRQPRIQQVKTLLLLKMFPIDQDLARRIQNIIEFNKYDIIYCRYIQFASKAGLYHYADKLLLDIDDMPLQALQIDFTKHKGLKKLYFSLLRKAYIRDTARWISKTKECFVPNKQQAEEYGISFLPNISTTWDNSFATDHPTTLLFIGKLDWNPNRDGILHFLDNCWPKIKNNIPNATLLIAGKGLNEKQTKDWLQKYPAIRILGFVDNLQDFYSKGNIVVCPIYSGAGTNIKIIEAMSMSKTVILSSESKKGYETFLHDGINCLIAKDDNEFIKKTVAMLENKNLQKEIGNQAYSDANRIYSFESICRILSSSLKQ